MRTIVKAVDSANEWMGRQMKWIVFILVVFMLTEVTLRYGFNNPTTQLPVMSTFTGATLYSLAFGYILLHRGHVRVDIFYSRLSERTQAILDVVLTVLLFFPVVGLLTYAAGEWAIYAWATGEKSMQTYWYPALGPIRTIVFVGMALFLVQGIVQFLRDLHMAIRSRPYD